MPIPPVLVAILRRWLDDNELIVPDALLFRTDKGTRPSTSNWGRAWRWALTSIGEPPVRVQPGTMPEVQVPQVWRR